MVSYLEAFSKPSCVLRDAVLKIVDVSWIQLRQFLGPWLGLHIERVFLETLHVLINGSCRFALLLEHLAFAIVVPFEMPDGVASPQEHAAGGAKGFALPVSIKDKGHVVKDQPKVIRGRLLQRIFDQLKHSKERFIDRRSKDL